MQFGSDQPNPNTYKTNEYVGMYYFLKEHPNSNSEIFKDPTILMDFQTLNFITYHVDPNNSGRLTNINLTQDAHEYYSPTATEDENTKQTENPLPKQSPKDSGNTSTEKQIFIGVVIMFIGTGLCKLFGFI